jgi:hypothetical protein
VYWSEIYAGNLVHAIITQTQETLGLQAVALRNPFMLATFSAFANKRMGVRRNALATFNAFVIPVLPVLNNPLMAAAFGAVANKRMGVGRDALTTFDAFILCIWHNQNSCTKGKRKQVNIFAPMPHKRLHSPHPHRQAQRGQRKPYFCAVLNVLICLPMERCRRAAPVGRRICRDNLPPCFAETEPLDWSFIPLPQFFFFVKGVLPYY